MFKKLFATSFFGLLSAVYASAPVALLTYPHSGTQWLTYCVCQLTARPAYVLNEKVWPWQSPQLQLPLQEDKAKFYHMHRPEFLRHIAPDYRKTDGKLLIILRNFKESLYRRVDSQEKAMRLITKASKGEGDFFKLIRNLAYFEAFPRDRRLLIYYEDLQLKPAKTLQKVMDFMEEDADVEGFVSAIEIHRKRCFEYYNTNPSLPGTKSFGKIKYHSCRAKQKEQRELDHLFKKKFPQFWNYFERFKT